MIKGPDFQRLGGLNNGFNLNEKPVDKTFIDKAVIYIHCIVINLFVHKTFVDTFYKIKLLLLLSKMLQQFFSIGERNNGSFVYFYGGNSFRIPFFGILFYGVMLIIIFEELETVVVSVVIPQAIINNYLAVQPQF